MSRIERFLAYAAAFEQTCADDNWSRLEPYFTEEAVYKCDDEPLAFHVEGRDAILAHLKDSMNRFDRHFDSRAVELLGEPEERDDEVSIKWRGTYTLAGAPDLSFEGTETAVFDGDRIRLLADTIDAEAAERFGAWMQEHGAKLGAA